MTRWPTKPLEEIAELYGGSTPSRDSPAFWGGDICWVTPTDLPMPDEGISVVSKTKDRITQAGLDNSSASVVPKGTVLFSSRATIGKVAIANMPLTTNQGFANFVPHSEVTSRFLAYALWFHREDIARLSGSTTFKEVSRSTLRKYHLPVPPLSEQERIVKLLDEADELRKMRAQADRRTADLIPALFYEMFGDPDTNPFDWPVKHAGDLMDACDYGTSQKANEDGRGIPVLRMGNVTIDGDLDLEELKTVELVDGELAKQRGSLHLPVGHSVIRSC
jgi:type I restriction enzyme, S subunit